MRPAGFTLLEVTVALAVLALGLVAIEDINASAARLHEASSHLTLATLLARSKMVDLEEQLNEEGFSDFDKEIDGAFDEEQHPDIKWKAQILKPDLTKSVDQLTALITGAMGGGAPGAGGASGSGGNPLAGNPLASLLGQSSLLSGLQLPESLSSPAGSSASSAPSNPTGAGLGGLLGSAANGLIQSQVQILVNQIQQGVREVRLTVSWMDGKKEDSLTVTTHLVVLNATGPGTSAAGAAPNGQSTNPMGSGTPGQPGTLGGAMPVMGGGLIP